MRLSALREFWAAAGDVALDEETGIAPLQGASQLNGPLYTEYLEEREVNSEYGQIYHEGQYQGDMIAVTGTISVEKREVPVAGQDIMVYRRGRVTRTGTLSIAKCDSRWEAMMIYFAGLTVEERRLLRNSGIDPFPSTTLMVKLDDPDSWGAEEIQLAGVRFWEIGLGYAGATIIQRDLPFSWQSERMVHAIPRPGNLQTSLEHIPAQPSELGYEGKPGGQTWPGFAPGGATGPVI